MVRAVKVDLCSLTHQRTARGDFDDYEACERPAVVPIDESISPAEYFAASAWMRCTTES